MEHYFSKKPKSEMKSNEIEVVILGTRAKLISGSGVFSKDRIDPGSFLLVEAAFTHASSAKSVLDLGCGNGIVGVFMKLKSPAAKVSFSDVNARALGMVSKNIRLNRLNKDDCKVIESDGFEKIPEMFDVILLNPPQHAGKEVCHRLISDSASHLNEGGTLLLVARHNKGGEGLSMVMKNAFGNMESRAKRGMFRVYESRKL